MAERLPSYTVKARNTSTSSENKIHDDAVAKTYGFRGGLVPGVTVYAYLTDADRWTCVCRSVGRRGGSGHRRQNSRCVTPLGLGTESRWKRSSSSS